MFKGLFRTCSKTPSKMGKTSSKSSEKWEKLWGKCVSAFCSMHYCADSLTEVLVDLQGVLCLNTRFVFFTVWCWIHTTNWQCITIVVTERKWWFWRVMWFYCSYVPKQLDKPVCGLENGCGKALDRKNGWEQNLNKSVLQRGDRLPSRLPLLVCIWSQTHLGGVHLSVPQTTGTRLWGLYLRRETEQPLPAVWPCVLFSFASSAA